MKRNVIVVAALLILPHRALPAAPARGGALYDLATGRQCPLEHTEVVGDVDGVVASMEVTQVFRNPFDVPIEAVYVFPLPHEAAVYDMEIRVGERHIRSSIERREDAQKIYAKARAEGHLAALLEEERPNVFTQSVTNVLPGETIRVTLRYFEELVFESGQYELVFPMVVGPRFIPGDGSVTDSARITPPVTAPGRRAGHDISLAIDVRVGSELDDLSSPSHAIDLGRSEERSVQVKLRAEDEIPNKDFVLRYRAAGPELDVMFLPHRSSEETDGYFVVAIHPGQAGGVSPVKDVPREVIFVVDGSGSMSGSPIAQVRQAMQHALGRLASHDRFQIIRFSNRAETFALRPIRATPVTIRDGLEYVSRLSGNGGTIMLDGVRAAVEQSRDPELLRVIVFMTDGYIGNEAAILDYLSKNVGEARLFSFGVGSSVNRFLIDEMATIGRGRAEIVLPADDPAESMDRLFERLRRPALTELELDWGSLQVTDIYPERLPDLFLEQPVIVYGRYREPGSGRLTLKGRRGGHLYEKHVDVSFPDVRSEGAAIAKLWARTQIASLSRRARWQPDAVEKETITQIALQHRLASAYTAFVALEERFLDRGEPRFVPVPLGMPAGVSYEGVFGLPGGGMSFSHIDVWNHMGFSAKLVNFVLILMSIAAVSVLMERSWTYVSSRPVADVEAAGRAARGEGLNRGAQRRAMERNIRENRHELSEGVRNLLTIGLTAPLVGLLGMVSGFLNAFRGMALTGSASVSAVSAGLAEALVPFAVGLAVGLVAIWSHSYLRTRVDQITARMTRATTATATLVDALPDGKLLQ